MLAMNPPSVGICDNVTSAWSNRMQLKYIPYVNTRQVSNFKYAWQNCMIIKSFPKLNFDNGTVFNFAWADCDELVEFPQISLPKATHLQHTWYNCLSLESFPLIIVPNAVSFNSAWENCKNLKNFPPNMFDHMTNIDSECFDSWPNCKLTPISVENILVSINSAKIKNNKTNTIVLGMQKLDLTDNAKKAVTSLKNKNWRIKLNHEWL